MKLLSIVIPTREREYYCIEVIKDILSYERDDLELVICDNSDTNQIEDYLNQNPDDRVVYKHIHGRINSVINMDTAMQMASGEYVCMIGDDDTILPAIFDVTEWAQSNNFDNVSQRDPINYLWPNSISPKGKIFWDEDDSRNKWEMLETSNQLLKFVRGGLIHYKLFLPRVYHGIVKREVLVKIKEKVGYMIGGLSPDIYLAVAVACTINTFFVVDSPFTIAGACPKSTSTTSKTGGHVGELESAPHLYKRGDYEWDERIPRLYSVETIWGETAIKALSEMGRVDLINEINQGFFLGLLLKNNTNIIKIVIREILKIRFVKNRTITFCNILYFYFLKSLERINKTMSNSIQTYNFSDVEHIRGAAELYLRSKGKIDYKSL